MPFVHSQGLRIYYEVEGTGPPLVLYHGTGDRLESWREYGYTEALKQDYQLILLDGRGHGRSDKPHDPGAYALDVRARDVVAVLDAIGIKRASYFGVSLGGWVGLGLLRYAPERIDSLIVTGAQPYGQSLEQFRQIFRKGLSAWILVHWQMTGQLSPSRGQRLLSNDRHALLASVTYDRPNIADMLPHVLQPCLLIAGGSESLHPFIKQCAAELPNGQLVELPQLNHMQAILHSELVLPHVKRFLADVREREVPLRAADA